MGNVLVPSIAQSNDTPKAPTPAIQNSLAQDAKPSLRQLSFKALVKNAIFRKVNSIQAGCFLRLDVDQMSPKAFGFCQDLSMDLHGSERWGRACNKSNESFLVHPSLSNGPSHQCPGETQELDDTFYVGVLVLGLFPSGDHCLGSADQRRD